MTPVQDVLCLSIPEEIDQALYLDDPVLHAALINQLTRMATTIIWGQWTHVRPVRVDDFAADWLLTNDLVDVERFQPAHNCPDCWAGNRKAEAFLRTHPGRWVAMANLVYTPVWSPAGSDSN
jgi:hypothetical protein